MRLGDYTLWMIYCYMFLIQGAPRATTLGILFTGLVLHSNTQKNSEATSSLLQASTCCYGKIAHKVVTH